VPLVARILLSPIWSLQDFECSERQRAIARLAEFADIDHYTGELTADQGHDVIGVIASSLLIHPEFYDTATDLRIIARYGVGFESVNLEKATESGVLVTTAAEHIDTVAEYAVAQWLATSKRVYTLNRNAHAGESALMGTREIRGSTLGIYGFGRIGQAVARLALPLLGTEGRLLVHDIRDDIEELAASLGAEAVSDPIDLFAQSDCITLHVAGGETIIRDEHLKAMQPHASLVNAARGVAVDDDAVQRALAQGCLYYYVVDDPVNGTREVHKDHPRVICTNHNAGLTTASANRLDETTVGQVIDTLEERIPANLLNPQVLEHPKANGQS
jgi:D-3-phosphoglycerate dehydrogenase